MWRMERSMMRRLSRTVCLPGCLLVVLSACGQRDASLAEVRGDVTFCGLPAVADVLFEPVDSAGRSTGRAASATTDDTGQFRLRLDESQTGAKIGRHRVTIRVQRLSAARDGLEAAGELPEGVSGALKSTHLAREVQAGENQFHFRLTF
jgi:hypothetical protein